MSFLLTSNQTPFGNNMLPAKIQKQSTLTIHIRLKLCEDYHHPYPMMPSLLPAYQNLPDACGALFAMLGDSSGLEKPLHCSVATTWICRKIHRWAPAVIEDGPRWSLPSKALSFLWKKTGYDQVVVLEADLISALIHKRLIHGGKSMA